MIERLDNVITNLELWINKKAVLPDNINISLNDHTSDETKVTSYMSPIKTAGGDVTLGPFSFNLGKGKIQGYLAGVTPTEAFALIRTEKERIEGNGEYSYVWRHRNGGRTEDFLLMAFSGFEEFFQVYYGADEDEYWSSVIKTEAMDEKFKESVEYGLLDIKKQVKLWL